MSNLSVHVRRYPHTEALFTGPATLSDGTRLAVEAGRDGVPLQEIFSFDVAEIPLLNYLAARELGLDSVGLPVFLARRFVQWMIDVPQDSPVLTPGDLAGKRIALNYYGNTDCTWARGILAEDYGVDLSGVTWVAVKPERLAGSRSPGNVELRAGVSVDRLLLDGSVDAVLTEDHGQASAAGRRRLWASPEAAIADWYRGTGYVPPLHMLVVKSASLAAHPGLAEDVCRLFDSAKATALVKYDFGAALPPELREIALRTGFPGAVRDGADRSFLGRDPLPYGMKANRDVLARFIRYAHVQQALWNAPGVDELFVD